MDPSEASQVWFERVYARLHLPYWAGVTVFGVVPILILLPGSYVVAGLWPQFFDPGVLVTFPILVAMMVIVHLAASYLRSSMVKWKEYADGLLTDGEKVELRELFGLRGFLVTLVVLLSVVQVVFVLLVLPKENSVFQNWVLTLPWAWWNVYAETFFWMFAYSMYKIYRVGRRPMKLKSFTEDRTLGLRPFGRLSLQMTALYFGFLILAFTAQISQVGSNNAGAVFIVGMTLLGVVLFFVPQISLHGKLVKAKQEAYAWIVPQHTRVLEAVRRNGIENTDEKVLGQLSGVESIRRDISLIHSWPFDVGIVVRLSAIVLSVVAILLSAVLRNFLRI